MLAADLVMPWATTAGRQTPTLASDGALSWSRRSLQTAATASGSPPSGVAMRILVEASSPVEVSTSAALIPVPPTSIPTAMGVI